MANPSILIMSSTEPVLLEKLMASCPYHSSFYCSKFFLQNLHIHPTLPHPLYKLLSLLPELSHIYTYVGRYIHIFGHTARHVGPQFPDQGYSVCPLALEAGITGPPGKSHECIFSLCLLLPSTSPGSQS